MALQKFTVMPQLAEVAMSVIVPTLSDESLRDRVLALTGGRRFVFLIISFKEERKVLYDLIAKVLERRFQIVCIRADHVASSGYILLNKIHDLIEGAELVLAEISEPSPNVYYEVGYSVRLNKPPLLIIERGRDVPTDLKGLEVVEYVNAVGHSRVFQRELERHLRPRLDKSLTMLREMLVGDEKRLSYIVTSPKYPGDRNRKETGAFDRRTFGDNLGIRGLFTAFGSIFGPGKSIELVSAQYSPEDLHRWDANLYLIGSRKVNPVAGQLFDRMQRPDEPLWKFAPAEGFPEKGDWPVRLYRRVGASWQLVEGQRKPARQTRKSRRDNHPYNWESDYGLIVRSPHPHHRHSESIVLALAGAHSLGTGAACLAATTPKLLGMIRDQLGPGVLEDRKQAFWVLVKGVCSKRDQLLDEEGVTIEEAGVF